MFVSLAAKMVFIDTQAKTVYITNGEKSKLKVWVVKKKDSLELHIQNIGTRKTTVNAIFLMDEKGRMISYYQPEDDLTILPHQSATINLVINGNTAFPSILELTYNTNNTLIIGID